MGRSYSLGYFDFSGEVTVKVTSLNKPLDNLIIRSLSSGFIPEINGNTLTFTVNEPCQLSIELLLIFANPLEMDAPDTEDENVIYYGPGIHKPERNYTYFGANTIHCRWGNCKKWSSCKR